MVTDDITRAPRGYDKVCYLFEVSGKTGQASQAGLKQPERARKGEWLGVRSGEGVASVWSFPANSHVLSEFETPAGIKEGSIGLLRGGAAAAKMKAVIAGRWTSFLQGLRGSQREEHCHHSLVFRVHERVLGH